jgi:hypothetical protein
VLPPALQNYFSLNLDVHSHKTRFSSNLHITRFYTSHGQRALHYRAAKLWNSLSTELKTLPDLKLFKSKLMCFLL